MSDKGYEMLPPSIREKTIRLSQTDKWEPEIGITIPEINSLTDLLIVSRSNAEISGKKFRFDNFNLIAKSQNIELWRRK